MYRTLGEKTRASLVWTTQHSVHQVGRFYPMSGLKLTNLGFKESMGTDSHCAPRVSWTTTSPTTGWIACDNRIVYRYEQTTLRSVNGDIWDYTFAVACQVPRPCFRGESANQCNAHLHTPTLHVCCNGIMWSVYSIVRGWHVCTQPNADSLVIYRPIQHWQSPSLHTLANSKIAAVYDTASKVYWGPASYVQMPILACSGAGNWQIALAD